MKRDEYDGGAKQGLQYHLGQAQQEADNEPAQWLCLPIKLCSPSTERSFTVHLCAQLRGCSKLQRVALGAPACVMESVLACTKVPALKLCSTSGRYTQW